MWFRMLLDALKRGAPRSQARQGAVRRRPAPRQLSVEALEDRAVPAALISVGDWDILEGNTGNQYAEVTVTLSTRRGNAVTVNYRTADGAASAGSDYDAVSGKLTFAKGQTSKTILIPLRGDRVVEPNEDFLVQLSNAKGARIADGQGVVTIADDEARISISDMTVLEGNSGTTSFTFTASLSVAYDLPVTVNYATSDGSASAGSDYTAAGEPLIFAPDQTSQTITVLVDGERLVESNETFLVSLSSPSGYAEITQGVAVGTILDDEPRISIAGAYNYGDYSPFSFTVSLSAADPELAVTVDFTTVDGTAFAGVDYTFTSGTLTFEPGETIQTITVDVLDPTSMPDKYFYVHLSGASTNALIVNEWAAGYWYYDYGYYDYGGWYDYGYYGDYYYY